MSVEDIDWQSVFYQVQDALWARARKRFGDTPDAESAMNFVLDTLSEDHFAHAGKGYTGRGSPEGFIVIRAVNLMHDYATAKYGRPRPPAWLARLGQAWTQAFTMLCLRRQLPETIVDALFAAANIEADRARLMLREIKARIPSCGQLSASEVTSAMEGTPDDPAQPSVERDLEASDVRTIVGALQRVFEPEANVGDAATPALADALKTLGASFDLKDDDRLLLRLVYQQGMTLAKAARAMRLKDYDIRRRHTRLMARLRSALEDCGLQAVAA